MMGELPKDQGTLFYDFCLEQFVSEDHLLRRIDRFLNFEPIREHLSSFYSRLGRPSVDPELMLRMLIVGYCYGIRSERQLCGEVHYNLAYRWFCRLGLEGRVPDHSTFTKNRHGRFRDSDVFRHLFETVVRSCMEEELVGGEGFAVDASVIRADAGRDHSIDGTAPIDWGDAEQAARPIREYVAALDHAAGLEATDVEEGKAEESSQRLPPKRISLTDRQARWTAAPGGPAYFAYSTNYLVDDRGGIIVDVEATPANRSEEVDSAKTMIDRVKGTFELKPKKLSGDTAYGTGEMLDWLVNERGIAPHIPVWERAERDDGTFSRSDFEFDEEADRYICPGGKELKRFWRKYKEPRTGITKSKTIIYRAREHDCGACALKSRCCPDTKNRTMKRSIYEAARDVAREIAKTDAYKQSRRDRKKPEMLFAHLKVPLKLRRLRLRGLSGAHDEFVLAATVQNLRRLAMWGGTGPPVHAQLAPA
jgi:transposase